MVKLKVFSDGYDVIVTNNRENIPDIMDRYYKVTGHTLRDSWKEIEPNKVLTVWFSNNKSLALEARALLAVGRSCWVGRCYAKRTKCR